jgi:hypothetical protein
VQQQAKERDHLGSAYPTLLPRTVWTGFSAGTPVDSDRNRRFDPAARRMRVPPTCIQERTVSKRDSRHLDDDSRPSPPLGTGVRVAQALDPAHKRNRFPIDSRYSIGSGPDGPPPSPRPHFRRHVRRTDARVEGAGELVAIGVVDFPEASGPCLRFDSILTFVGIVRHRCSQRRDSLDHHDADIILTAPPRLATARCKDHTS